MTKGVGSVRMMDIKDRGDCDDGVRMRRVRAVSIGERMMAVSVDAAVLTMRVARGYAVVRMSEVDTPEGETDGRSVSGSASRAAIKERRKVSVVRARTEYTNVAFVPFHKDKAPEEDEREERASRSE